MIFKRERVLIIDDEKDFSFFLKKNLQIIGNYEVFIANEGKKGIHLAGQVCPDVILLDVIMPKLNGYGVLKTLKSDDRTINIPVIMLTALDDDISRIEASSLYCEDYMVKPVDVALLKSKIEYALSRFARNVIKKI